MPFITFEGIDGSGKTALADKIYWKVLLKYKGLKDVYLTAEPREQVLKETIRIYGDKLSAKDFACLFAADRIMHTLNTIAPKVARGILVLCDRYTLSSLAYQSDGSIEGNYRILWQNDKALKPDLTFLLDLPASEAVKRSSKRNEGKADLFDDKGVVEQECIRRRYLSLPGWLNGDYGEIIILDALRPIDELVDEVMSKMVERGYLPAEGGEIVEEE